MIDDYEDCKFYLKTKGACAHKRADDPRHSPCIGQDCCNCWDDTIANKIKK